MTSTKAPKLRFKEFGGYWQEKKLGGIISDHKESTKTQDEYPVMTSSRNGIVLQKDYYGGANRLSARSNIGYNILPKRYITYRSRSDDGLFVFNMNNTGKKGIVSYFYPVFTTISSNNNPYFLLTLLNQNWQLFYKYSVGTSQRVLSHSELKKIKLSVPDFEEQQKIAKFLIGVDERIELQDKKVKLLEKYKKGIMQKIFSQQIRFKDKDSKGYPDWQEKKLEELCSTAKSGGTPAATNKQYFKEGNIPFLAISDMTEQGKYLIKTSKFITKDGLNNSASWIVPPGSIIYSMYASVGLVAINNIPIATSQAVINLIPNTQIKTEYFYYNLIEFKEKVHRFVETGTQGNLNAQTVKNFKIPLPAIKEQQKIAEFLSSIDDKIGLEKNKLKQAKQFKKALLQQMFV